MKAEQILQILEKQEETLQFTKFDAQDAWNLGCLLVDEARKNGFHPAISIRLNNGFTVFQYGFEGTGPDHEHWMVRKQNTTMVKMISSMRADYLLKTSGGDLKTDWFMDPMEYSLCGGAFPIKVKGIGMIGTILVSGISVLMDHELIIGALARFLNAPEVERITE